MKKFILYIALVLLFFNLTLCSVEAKETSLVINEILPNPQGSDTGNEWIELYNSTSAQIDLSTWSIKDKTKTQSLSGVILPGAYQVVFTEFSLNNSDEEVSLLNNGEIIEQVAYATSTEGISLERINPYCLDFLPNPSSDTRGSVNHNYDKDHCGALGKVTIYINGQKNFLFATEQGLLFSAEIDSELETKQVSWQINSKNYDELNPVITFDKEGKYSGKVLVTFVNNETLEKEFEFVIQKNDSVNEQTNIQTEDKESIPEANYLGAQIVFPEIAVPNTYLKSDEPAKEEIEAQEYIYVSPSKLGFGVLGALSTGSYTGMVLDGQSRRKILEFLLKLVKG